MKSENIVQRLSRHLPAGGTDPPLARSEAFSRFYEQTHLSVYRYIYGLTGGPPAEVEDFTAETYLRAWNKRTAYRGDLERAIAWVLRISRNLVIDTYRHNKAGPTHTPESLEETRTLPNASGDPPEEQIIAAEGRHLALNLLLCLPADEREMLVLRYLLDWKVQQISQYLEIPENTVSVTMRRALEKLRSRCPAEKELT